MVLIAVSGVFVLHFCLTAVWEVNLEKASLYVWQREQARSSKSCAIIGYLHGQDGVILPAKDCLLPERHYSQ